uniref:Uncharacterized protein n=1 Tax=Cacopsylla melanoneura TaxID=428564 RepID=A0A8D8TU30_9HEMI
MLTSILLFTVNTMGLVNTGYYTNNLFFLHITFVLRVARLGVFQVLGGKNFQTYFWVFPPFFFFYLYQDKSSRENTSENLVFGNKREYLARKMCCGNSWVDFFD